MDQGFKLAPMMRLCSTATVLVLSLSVGGCVPVALTAAGVGSSVMVTRQLNGVTYRTFSAPLIEVRTAALNALRRMEIGFDETDPSAPETLIQTWAGNRSIEIELESLTPATTRMRVVVRKDGGLLTDGATAMEIISQTANLLPEH